MKTLDIIAKEWFDRVNGNSYHSVRTIIDHATEAQKTLLIPFRYGYGDSYLDSATDALNASGIATDASMPLSLYCRENGIILRSSIERKCKKRDVKAWGEA